MILDPLFEGAFEFSHSLRLERTGGRPARHGRASVAAGRSPAGRWAAALALPDMLGFIITCPHSITH